MVDIEETKLTHIHKIISFVLYVWYPVCSSISRNVNMFLCNEKNMWITGNLSLVLAHRLNRLYKYGDLYGV